MDRAFSIIGTFFLILLYVVLSLLFLLILVCISHPKIIFKYKDKPQIIASLWFIRFNITRFLSRPKRKKKPKILHFDGTLFGEMPPEEKKKKNKRKKKTAEKKVASKAVKNEEKKFPQSISEALELITDILSDIKEPLKKVLKVNIRRLYITLASEDPHKTALLFGNTNAAIGYLIFVCRKFAALDIDEENVGVYSDFCSEKTTIDVNIALTLSFRHIIICGFKAATDYLKNKK